MLIRSYFRAVGALPDPEPISIFIEIGSARNDVNQNSAKLEVSRLE
jgi:hypothetical protein